MRSLIVCSALLILLPALVLSQQETALQSNLIEVGSGTVLISASSEYGGGWSAVNLSYGLGRGW